MKRRSGMAAFVCGIVLALPGSVAAQSDPAGKNKPAPATPGVVAADRGRFRLLFDGQQVGTEEFAVTPSGGEWISRGTVEIKLPGGSSTQVTAELRLAADGRPLEYQWTSQGPKKISGAIKFAGNSATMELRSEGAQPFTQEFQFESPQVVILDNNLYHHYGLLVRLYNWNTKGAQTFSVLIPQDLTPGTVTVEWGGPREMDGMKTDLLRVRSADLEIELYASDGRLVRLAVPTSKAEIRRE